MNDFFKAKNYEDTFLYGKANYERKIVEFMTTSDEVDKTSNRFADIVFDVKRRQVTNCLYSVLNSNKIVLLANNTPLPKSFKVFSAIDMKGDKTLKTFIDVSEIIKTEDGMYKCTNIDVLIAYLASAMTYRIYFADPRRIITNNIVIQTGSEIFVDLFRNVLNHLKIKGLGLSKTKCDYLSALYFQINILGKSLDANAINVATRISKIATRDQALLKLLVTEADFANISTFIAKIAEVLKVEKLTTDVFVEKWIWCYGPSTLFADEIFPAFATMILYAYCGVYLNQQKTIETAIGAKNLTAFCNAIFHIGEGAI